MSGSPNRLPRPARSSSRGSWSARCGAGPWSWETHTFATATTLPLKGSHRLLFVDGASELALVAGREGGAHLVQRVGDKVKRVAKHPGKVTRCLRVGDRLFVADGDQAVCEVVGLPGSVASH